MINVSKNGKLYGFIIAMVVIVAGILLFVYTKQKENDFKNSFIKTYYQVVDAYNLGESSVSEESFFSQENSLDRLKQFNYTLNNSPDINFVEFNDNHIEIMGYYDKPLDLVNGYGHKDLSNQKIFINGNDELITPLNSIQLSSEMSDLSNLNVSEGRNFEPKDFKYDDNNIPLLMGYDFLEHYNVGDEIKVCFYSKIWNGVVVGFLEEDSEINMDWNKYVLNPYIVIPYFDEINVNDLKDVSLYANINSDHFIKSYYLSKNNGYLIFENKDDFKKYEKIIQQKAKEYDMDFILLRGY